MIKTTGISAVVLFALSGLCFAFQDANEQNRLNRFEKKSHVPAAKIADSEASEVLVLATVHLRSYGEDFNHDVLEGLLGSLEKYDPEIIAIESAAPLFVRDMFNSGGINIEIMKDIGGFEASELGKEVRAALETDWFEAKKRSMALLTEIKAAKQGSDVVRLRMELVMNFLAMNDPYSALLQWSYLPENERTASDEWSQEVVDFFSKHIHASNENTSIGLALARRLNHQRIFCINDHRDKEDFIEVADRISKMLGENEFLKTQPWKPLLDEMTERRNKAYQAGDLLPFYVWLNSETYLRKDLDSQWQVMFEAGLPDGLAQTRVAFWDVRNFGIAANIRRAAALNPGKRTLVIIGASHKIFLDALLRECMDVKVVQLKDYI